VVWESPWTYVALFWVIAGLVCWYIWHEERAWVRDSSKGYAAFFKQVMEKVKREEKEP